MAIGNIPFTVQAKLIYLIENLGISEDENTQTTNEKLDAIMSFLSPPTTCETLSLNVAQSEIVLIAAELAGSIRKSFSVFNESTTAILYVDYATGVTATRKKLQLPPLYYWTPENCYQGIIYGVSSEANTPVEIRIER